MDVLILIVAVLLVGGVFSLQNAIIKPVADWLYPQPPAPEIVADDSPASSRGLLDVFLLLVLALGLVGGVLTAIMRAVGWM